MANRPNQRLIEELMLAVMDLQNATDVADQAISDRLGFNRTDARCLSCLITRGPMTAGRLAEMAGIKPGALTFAVDRLREAGFADRSPDPQDRRRVIIAATDKAQRLADQVWSQTVAEAEAKLGRYTEEELRLLTEFVRDQVELQQRQAGRIRSWSSG